MLSTPQSSSGVHARSSISLQTENNFTVLIKHTAKYELHGRPSRYESTTIYSNSSLYVLHARGGNRTPMLYFRFWFITISNVGNYDLDSGCSFIRTEGSISNIDVCICP